MRNAKQILKQISEFDITDDFSRPCSFCGQGFKGAPAYQPTNIYSYNQTSDKMTLYSKNICPGCLNKYCAKNSQGRWEEKKKGLLNSVKQF